METPICRNCSSYLYVPGAIKINKPPAHLCTHEKSKEVDAVTGKVTYKTCNLLRQLDGMGVCGPNGAWFAERTQEQIAAEHRQKILSSLTSAAIVAFIIGMIIIGVVSSR